MPSPGKVSPSEWGTIQEAADRHKVSTKTIRRYITQGLVEAERFGPRLIRVNLATLDNAGRSLQSGGGPVVDVQDYIARVVDAAPPLTTDQRSRLAALLVPAGGGAS